MLKLSIIQGLAEGAAESLTKFFLERFNTGYKKPEASGASIIQNYLQNRQIKQEKVKQIIAELVESSQKQTEELEQKLEQAKQNHKKRGEIR